MTTTQALDTIARSMGRDSLTYRTARAMADQGNTRAAVALATTGPTIITTDRRGQAR